MTRARAALLTLVLVAGVLGADRLAARDAVPVPASWAQDLHPLLGAAPPGSFARAADADPWADLRGKPFARAVPPAGRVLLLGGSAALSGLVRLEAAVAPREVVCAARESYGTAQEVVVLGRFAPLLGASAVVAVDGEELAAPARPIGWTPEWDWAALAVREPALELVARGSGLVRRALLGRPPAPAPLELRRRGYTARVRALAALARARGQRLAWVFAPPASVPADVAAAIRSEATRDVAGLEAFATWDEALAALR